MERIELNNIRVAVFDLDGTLFDSVWLWDWIDIEFLKARGRVPTPEYRRGIAALGNREVAEFTVRFYGLSDTPEALSAEWSDMARDAYKNKIKLFDGAREYLDELKACGVRLVAATSLAKELAHAGLASNNVFDFFERVFISDEMGLNKNSPEFFLHIASELKVSPAECVVFDDVATAAASATSAGMTAISVRHDKSDRYGAAGGELIINSFECAPKLKM